MAYEVSATRYRPQSFDELVGQDFVVSTLKNSIQSRQIANAYLLSGPRGVGKTSAARIIAKALNCDNGPTSTPCNSCDNCTSITKGYNTDVIEIDGASNTSINDIRVIQEEILYPPVSSKYKIYIIDEVHMLSKSAFNALLKTIEEPPKHVVFIFATTEVNKVLPTIRSRCQQFSFRLIPTNIIYNLLINVLKTNDIKFKDEAILWIAQQGKGSMRDAYTLLDQVSSFCSNEITLKKIEEKLGMVGEERLFKIVNSIIEQNRENVFLEFFSLLESGISNEQIINELIEFFRNILFAKINLLKNSFTGINFKQNINKLSNFFSYYDIENILEILFRTYESSKYSLEIQIELEIMLLKLINYKDLIRPKGILTELNLLKNTFLKKDYSISKNNENININGEKKSAKENKENKFIVKDAEKSELLNIIKSKIESTHFQLFTALNNIYSIEEKDNKMYLLFTHKMHYDIVKENEDLLTSEAIAIIGPAHNKNFKIIARFNIDEKKETTTEVNINKIKDVFKSEEI